MVTRYVPIVALCVLLAAAPSQIMAADESNPSAEQPGATGPALSSPWLESARQNLSKFGELTRQLANPMAANAANDSERSTASQPYVWVRVSKDRLAKFVEREVNRERPARDVILGITFTGTSRTTGTTRLELHPNEDRALGHVVFQGQIQSRTTGDQGPATLHYLANSTFRATKPLAITQSGLQTWPAKAQAPTRLTPIDITTSLPRVRDRLVRQIAWRRARESQSEADAIVSDHRTRDLREGLDQRLDEVVATIQAKIQAEFGDLEFADGGGRPNIRSRSTAEFVEVALLPARLNPDQFKMPEFQVAEKTDLAIRVHRSALAHVLANPRLRDKLAPLTDGLVQSRVNSTPTNEGSHDQRLLAIDSEWLAFDVSASAVAMK